MSASRNAPCPCGSGRKYKHCHGAVATEASPLESKSVERKPSLEQALNLHHKGFLPEAEMLCREILQRSPRDADAMNVLGILCAERGDPVSASEWIGKALAIDSKNAAYQFNFGKTLLRLKRARDAGEALERAASLNPDYADAYNELGLARAETGSFQAAETAFRKALSLQPGYWEAHSNLSLLLHRQGRNKEAELGLRRALELEPRSADALRNLGMVLRAQGRAAEAEQAYRSALALSPGDPATLTNMGNALLDLARHEEAVACFQHSVALAPDYADAHYNWGLLCARSGRFQLALEKFRAALAINPNLAEAEIALASSLYDLGRTDEALDAVGRALRLRPDDREAHSQLLFLLLHSPDVGPQQVFDEHREWARRHASGFSFSPAEHKNTREPGRRLRIGYVSGDFRLHSVAQFFEPVLARHDRSGFEIICYYNLDFVDATTERLRGHADRWRDIRSLGDDEVAQQMRSDGVDVLVDLSGHTNYNRLLVFARNPAPVQVTWLGYPETTGLGAVAYRISDAIADPPGAGGLASETLLHLPRGFLCYEPPSEAPMVDASPASTAGYVTFGSFNSLAKLNAKVVSLWQQILAAVPGSRLLIKTKLVVDPGTRASCMEWLAAQGIDPGRVDCAPGTQTLAEHLASYNKVDIALDPFPYNGTTITCEALWMGVPVVTLSGDRHSGRVGASVLTRIGMQDMVAHTAEAYVAAAVALARDLPRLSALRAGMRDRIAASPLTDATGFTRSLEQAYRLVWQRWCENPRMPIAR